MALPTRTCWWRPSLLAPKYGQGLLLASPADLRTYLARHAAGAFDVPTESPPAYQWDRGTLTDLAQGLRVSLPTNVGGKPLEGAIDRDVGGARQWALAWPLALRGWINPRIHGTAAFARACVRFPARRTPATPGGEVTGLGFNAEQLAGVVAHWKRPGDPHWRMTGDAFGSQWPSPPSLADHDVDDLDEFVARLDVSAETGPGTNISLVALQAYYGGAWMHGLSGEITYGDRADLCPFLALAPNADVAPPDAYLEDVLSFEATEFDPWMAQVMPVSLSPGYDGSLDLVIPGKNAALCGHHGWSERPGLGWCAEYGINTYSWVEQTPLLAEFYQDDYPDLAGMPWWPQGDFTFLMDLEVPDWTAATVQRIAGVYDQDFSNELWMLFAASGGLHLHVAGLPEFSLMAPAPGVVQIGVRRTGGLVSLIINGAVPATGPAPWPTAFWKILAVGKHGGDDGLPSYRGAMSLWSQPLTDAQLREAYAELIAERILNRSFEVAGDVNAGNAANWTWFCDTSAVVAGHFFKDYTADRGFEGFAEDAAGLPVTVAFAWWDGAPALFGHTHAPYEAFGPGGWAPAAAPYRENGYPWTWPAASVTAIWTASGAYVPPLVEAFEDGWGAPMGAPAAALALRAAYPVRIVEHQNDRLALYVVRVSPITVHLVDLSLAPGTYADALALRAALAAAQVAAGVPAAYQLAFAVADPTGIEADRYPTIAPPDASRIAWLARAPGVPTGAPPDARATLGIPAGEEILHLADPAGATVDPLRWIMYEDATTWLNGLGAWADFSGDPAEDFEAGWSTAGYRFQMEAYPVIAVVGGVTPPRIGIAGDHRPSFPGGAGCVAMDEPRIQASYTVVDSILIGPDTYVGMAVADLIADVGGELYPAQQATAFNNGDPDSAVQETFNQFTGWPAIILWWTDVYP